MAVRTTAVAVQGILLKDYDGISDLTPFIATATQVVDRASDLADDADVTLSSALLEMMERWLAAHFYACADKPYQSRSTRGASASFAGKTDMYFEATLYGQMAMRLDTSGSLQAIGGASGESGTVAAAWLGEE